MQLRKNRLSRGNQAGLASQTDDRCCASQLETEPLSDGPACTLIDQQQRL
jgi:hypothetical protein